jgi:hypothetical protein
MANPPHGGVLKVGVEGSHRRSLISRFSQDLLLRDAPIREQLLEESGKLAEIVLSEVCPSNSLFGNREITASSAPTVRLGADPQWWLQPSGRVLKRGRLSFVSSPNLLSPRSPNNAT